MSTVTTKQLSQSPQEVHARTWIMETENSSDEEDQGIASE